MNSLTSTLRSAALALVVAAFAGPAQAQDNRAPDLPVGCEQLRVPEGNKVSLHVFAQGVQIYKWDATASRWVFQAPAALLYANAGFHQPIGVHFGGPTWMSNSGSTVMGRLVAPCPVDANAIPWLLLEAAASAGPGPFEKTTFIQRVNTVGGKAPARAGTPDEIVEVPYTAEYFFYRAK